MKGKYPKIIGIFASVIFIITVITLILSTVFHKKVDKQLANLSPEDKRAANYTVVTDSNSFVQNTNNNVKFSVFFTRDLDGDGNAEKYDGTCKNINSKDILYIDLNVLSEGKLKNAKITINGTNFNYSMKMIKDTVLKENYLSDDIKEIELNDINAGTQKLIFGDIIANIGKDTANYSKQNTITLTGIYVDDNNNEKEISVTRNLTIDWYGSVRASLDTMFSTYYYNDLNTDTISFSYKVCEKEEDLLLKDVISTAVIPDLNGFAPTSVICTTAGVDANYNEQTKTITLKRSSTIDENGIIKNTLSKNNLFTINVTYPQQAFDEINSYTKLEIPVTGQYIGYNNRNEEFENPINSNIVSKNVTVVFMEQVETGYVYNFDIKLADKIYVIKPYIRYIMSKKNLLELYENEEYTANYDYEVNWYASKGNTGKVKSFIMNETKNAESNYGDKFDEFVMDNYTANKGIYFTNADIALGIDGEINVFNNDTNELIKTFTYENWNTFTKQSPYIYETSVKHIRVETTTPENNTTFIVHNIKTLDVKKIVQDYTKEQIKNVKMINTYLTGIADVENTGKSQKSITDSAYLVSESSYAELGLSDLTISTQETINQEIYITTSTVQSDSAKWRNGEFIVEFPKEIINAEIKSVEIDNSNVKILGYDISKQNGKYIARILTENNTPDVYKITINTQITPDSRIPSTTSGFKLYAYNENCNDYYYTTTDTYDVNNNGNTEENVGTSSKNLKLLSPVLLVTLETISNYNEENNVTIAPNIAEIDKGVHQAKVNINITNNYPNIVTGVKILGKIPYKDNTYIINGKTMNSEFNTTMVNTGIRSSNSNSQDVNNQTKIYYSEKENPTTDITNSENGWKLLEDVTDFSKIKSYLINMNKHEVKVGEKVEFNYDVIIPENLAYNTVSYSNHAVYYDLQTDGGKLTLSTEPAKVGMKVVSQYDLDLTKYKKESNTKIAGAIYSLEYKEKDTEGVEQTKNKIITTNSEGKGIVKNLNVNLEYKLKEIKAPDSCELNNGEITFKINENGELIFVGDAKEKSFSLNDKTLKISVEDEVKYNLILNKTKIGTSIPINNVRFSVTDKNGNKKTAKTTNGIATIEALSLNKEYTLKENVTPGNVELKNGSYKFKLIRNNGVIEVKTISNTLAQGNGVITDSANEIMPKFTVNVQNEIKYSLNLNKIDLDGNKINGARFKISGKGFDGNAEYISSNGILTIPNLYVNETYIVEETKNIGYYLDSSKNNKITFKITRGSNGLEVSSLNCGEGISISGNANIIENGLDASMNLTVQNEKIPTYNLNIIKQNENQEIIPGAQFKLISFDDNTEQTITIDEQGNGTFTGLYEYIEGKSITGEYGLQEIYAPEGYRLDTTIWKFKGSKDANGNIIITSIEGDNIVKKNKTTDEQTGDTIYTNAITTTTNDATVTILNKTIFKLTKIGDLGKFIPGAKFEITDLDGNSVTGVDGKEIGIIETDENGQISANLGEGLYKVTEIEAPEGYELPANVEDRIYYFGIGANRHSSTSGKIDTVEWAKSVSAKYLAEFNDTIETPDGGIIAVGCAKREIDINGDGTQDTQGYGGSDAIIVKYNDNGSIAWTKVLGGEHEDELYTIAKVPNGGYVVAGYVEGGEIYYNGTQIDASGFGNEDGIIVRIDENGNYLWSQSVGGTGTDRINSIAVNSNGDIGVTGSYYNTIYTNKNNSATLSTTAEANKAGFIIVYSATGSYKWSKNLVSNENTYGKAITATSNGFAVGVNYQGKLDFGGSSKVYATGHTQSVVISYNNNGTVQWWKNFGNEFNIGIYDLIVYNDPDTEGQKDIVMVGGCVDRIYSDNEDVDLSTGSSSCEYQGMIIKLKETDGSAVKAIGMEGDGTVISSITPTSDGGLLFGGWTKSSYLNYEGTKIKNAQYTSTNNGFIIKLDKTDSLVFSDIISGEQYNQIKGVVESTNNGVYAIGDFGSKTLLATGQSVLSNSYTYDPDAFVIKYGETVTGPEVPELQEITISNELLKYTLTTEVGINNLGERDGGTITGEFDDDKYVESNNIKFVENIKYGYSNSEDIVIKPNEGYKIQSITIDGEKYSFTPDETTGIVTIPAGYIKDIKENHHIIATFVSSSRSIKIIKKDKNGNLLEGATFEIKSNQTSKTYTATTDKNGQAILGLEDIGKYTIQETQAPEHYILDNTKTEFELLSTDKDKTLTIENIRKTGMTVHHYLKQSDGTLTTNKVAEDEQYEGTPGENYTTSPKSNLDKFSLQKDNNGEYIIPENGSGTYGNEEIEVIYYYEASPMKLVIHHYLEGTEDKLVDDETILTNTTVTFDENGKYIVSANNTYKIGDNQNYKNLLTDYIFTKVTTQSENENGDKGDIQNAEITEDFEYNTNSEITYYYTLNTHNITTQVKTHKENRINELTNTKEEIDVTGGNITGEYNNTYIEDNGIKFVETVKQKEDSTAEITATPNAGYKVSKITLISTADDGTQTETIIYGNGASETTEVIANLNADKTVSVTTFKSVIANKHIIVEFEPLSGEVITHHIIKGQTTDYKTVTSNDLIGEPYYTGSIDIEHYQLVETSNNTEGRYTEDKINVYYYYDIASYEYSVHYFYDGVENTSKTEKIYAKYQENISNYTDKNIDGYKFEKAKVISNNGDESELPLIIKDDSSQNVINVYYVKDNFEYSVHYFYDGIEDLAKVEKTNAEFASQISTYTDKIIEGYKLEKAKALDNDGNETELPLIIKSDKNKNIINVYYIKDDFGYTVHYFYDGIEDLTKLETKEAEFAEEILTYSDKNKTGYKLEKAKALDNNGDEAELPLIIKTDVNKNIINVYYVKDEFEYTVHYFYDGIEDTNATEKLKATYQDTITTYTDKNKTGCALEKTEHLPLQITEKSQNNIINIYYRTQYKITTDIIEHTEKYKDGTIKDNVKGGSISGEDLSSYENVFKGESSTKDIIIKPDNGYEIESVIIKDGKDAETEINLDINSLEDGNGNIKLNASNGYFTGMSSNKHINVKFRRKSSVIVKYIDKETNNALIEEIEIKGYEGKTYETSRKPVEYYNSAGVTYEDNTPYDETADNKMFADTTTIIYWYEKIKSNIVVKHIEVDELDIKDGLTLNSGKIIDEANIRGDILTSKDISRNTYENTQDEKYKKLIPTNGPEVTTPGGAGHILIIASETDNLKTVEFIKDTVTEIRYYYIKEHSITTKIILHDEEIINSETGEKQTVKVAGGTISTEYAKDENDDFILDTNGNKIPLDVYEKIKNRGYNKKEIEIVPNALYRIKKVIINDKTYTKEELNVDENGKVILKAGNNENSGSAFFKDIQEDKNISVEFEKIPGKVVVEYIDADTNEKIHADKEINGYVGDEYNEERIQLDSYITADIPTENNKGNVTEDTIKIIFYYKKQFKITTDVIEHMELAEIPTVEIKGNKDGQSESSEKKLIKVKGGTITGEDEQSYETIIRGKENNKEIVLKPDENYRIKYFVIYDGIEEIQVDVNNVVEKDGKKVISTKYNQNSSEGNSESNTYIFKEGSNVIVPIKYFKNTQSDKKITVEYERIPSKVIVNYKEKDSDVNIAKQEQGKGYLNLKYKTYPKEIQYYKLIENELPENAEGKFAEEDTVVTYLYRKLLFNIKVEKEFSSIQVNGEEKLGKDKKLAKIDISNTEISKTNILVKYRIIVTNTAELPGRAKLVENIPAGFIVSNLTSAEWENVDGKLQCITQELQPGESAEYEVAFEWNGKSDCIGSLESQIEIGEIQNEAGFKEETEEDNEDKCTLILAVRTGEDERVKMIICIGCFVLAVLCGAVYVGVENCNKKKN